MGGWPSSGYSWIILYLGRSSKVLAVAYASCRATSMGSKGIGSEAHMASRISAFSGSSRVSSRVVTFFDSSTYNLARLILFSVIVPVLSVQMTVALPRVSTVFICLTTIPIFIRRQAPRAMKVVKATGISSGRMLMARVSALSKLSSTSRD